MKLVLAAGYELLKRRPAVWPASEAGGTVGARHAGTLTSEAAESRECPAKGSWFLPQPSPIMNRKIAGPIALLALAVTLACSGADVAGSEPHARLVLTDSIVLEQGDSNFLARPSAILADAEGYWVADMNLGNLRRYDREGGYERTMGRKGSGPGEFGSPFRLASAGTDRLMVLDMGDFSAVGVDTRDGTHAFRHSLGGMFFGTSMHVSGDSLLLGGLRMGSMGEAGFSSADAGLWLDVSSGVVTSAAQAPEGTANMMPSFEFASIVKLNDGVLALWPALNYARLHRWDGTEADLIIPAHTRPLPPGDLQEQLMSRKLTAPEAWTMLTIPWATGSLSNGDAALVNLAFTLRPEEGLSATGAFVSVLRAGADSACVDAPLQLLSEEMPVVAFHGDTLLTLDQVVQGEDALVMVRRFAIDTDACEWLPMVKN